MSAAPSGPVTACRPPPPRAGRGWRAVRAWAERWQCRPWRIRSSPWTLQNHTGWWCSRAHDAHVQVGRCEPLPATRGPQDVVPRERAHVSHGTVTTSSNCLMSPFGQKCHLEISGLCLLQRPSRRVALRKEPLAARTAVPSLSSCPSSATVRRDPSRRHQPRQRPGARSGSASSSVPAGPCGACPSMDPVSPTRASLGLVRGSATPQHSGRRGAPCSGPRAGDTLLPAARSVPQR